MDLLRYCRIAPEVVLEIRRSRAILRRAGTKQSAVELGSRVTILEPEYDARGRLRPGRLLALGRERLVPGGETPGGATRELDLFDGENWLRLERLGVLTAYLTELLRPIRRAAWGRWPRVAVVELAPRAYERGDGKECRRPTEPELALFAEALLSAGAREVRLDLPGLPLRYVFAPEGLKIEKPPDEEP